MGLRDPEELQQKLSRHLKPQSFNGRKHVKQDSKPLKIESTEVPPLVLPKHEKSAFRRRGSNTQKLSASFASVPRDYGYARIRMREQVKDAKHQVHAPPIIKSLR